MYERLAHGSPCPSLFFFESGDKSNAIVRYEGFFIESHFFGLLSFTRLPLSAPNDVSHNGVERRLLDREGDHIALSPRKAINCRTFICFVHAV